MPRTEEANQQLREAQQKKILQGARQAFARKGPAATMADIAAAAQVSQGLAYRYFTNKDAIYIALMEQAVKSSQAVIRQAQEMPGSPLERLHFLLSNILENKQGRLEFNHLVVQASDGQAAQDDLRKQLALQSQSYHALVRQLIVEGQAVGEVAADDPDQLTTAVMACIRGLMRLNTGDTEQSGKKLPEAGILLRMLKP